MQAISASVANVVVIHAIGENDAAGECKIMACTDKCLQLSAPLVRIGGLVGKRADPLAFRERQRCAHRLVPARFAHLATIGFLDPGGRQRLLHPPRAIAPAQQRPALHRGIGCVVDIAEFRAPVGQRQQIGWLGPVPPPLAQLAFEILHQFRPGRGEPPQIMQRKIPQARLVERLWRTAFGPAGTGFGKHAPFLCHSRAEIRTPVVG
ncbi:MAG: hypothetical protein ACK4ZW_16640 [Blastomonas sp.]